MAPKTLVSRKRRPPPDDEARTDSNSNGGAAAPQKKPKFVAPLKHAGSSPSATEEKAKGKGNRSPYKVFGDDDEITLLTRLADFWANGKNNKWTEFHLFVKDGLRNQFTKIQVSEKIRNLKKKFDANWEMSRANGTRIDLSDPHESAVFELSKALWGDEKAEKEQVVEEDEGSKTMTKTKMKTKQVNESGEENVKSKKPEPGVEELVGDENWSILRLRKVVDENGEGSKKAKKGKEGDELELDERTKELAKEDIQVEVNDEGNKISSKETQVDGGNKKKTKKAELVDECGDDR